MTDDKERVCLPFECAPPEIKEKVESSSSGSEKPSRAPGAPSAISRGDTSGD